jgi:hypothetical protein
LSVLVMRFLFCQILVKMYGSILIALLFRTFLYFIDIHLSTIAFLIGEEVGRHRRKQLEVSCRLIEQSDHDGAVLYVLILSVLHDLGSLAFPLPINQGQLVNKLSLGSISSMWVSVVDDVVPILATSSKLLMKTGIWLKSLK